MPQRFLKPGIVTSGRFNACCWMAQSFYVRLITLVDDFGRYEAEPALLKSHGFPLHEDLRSPQVQKLCEELQANQLAVFYRADGKAYLQLTNWTEKPRAQHSRYPAFTSKCEQLYADAINCSPPSSSSPSSSPPPSPTRDAPVDVGDLPAIEPPHGWPRTEAESRGRAGLHAVSEEFAAKCWLKAATRGWHDGKDVPIRCSFAHWLALEGKYERERLEKEKRTHGSNGKPHQQGAGNRNEGIEDIDAYNRSFAAKLERQKAKS